MSEQSFEEQVNTTIGEVKKGDDGKLEFPEGTTEAVKFAATSEIRRRDTQSALTKTKDELSTATVKNNKILENWAKDITATLSDDEQNELNELKHSDPDKWRQRLDEIEISKQAQFEDKKKEIDDAASKETAIQKRTRLLKEYNEANPEHMLSDDVIDNDIPPRITKKLANNEISFEEFLSEANKYLTTGKVIGGDNDDAPDDPDLGDMGGKQTPSDASVKGDAEATYKDEMY